MIQWSCRASPSGGMTAVDERPVLFDPVRGRQHEHLGLDRGWIGARRVPELRARGRQRVHDHEPLEVSEGLHDLIRVGPDARRGHSAEHHALHLALERLVIDRHPRRVRGRLGDEVERELVVLGRDASVPALEQAHHEVAVVGSEEVPRVRIALLRRARRDVVVESLLARSRNPQVARQDLPTDGVVGVSLDVRVAALGVHPTTRPTHVAQEELENRT